MLSKNKTRVSTLIFMITTEESMNVINGKNTCSADTMETSERTRNASDCNKDSSDNIKTESDTIKIAADIKKNATMPSGMKDEYNKTDSVTGIVADDRHIFKDKENQLHQ